MSGPYGIPETVLSFVGAGPRPARRFGKYVGAHSVRPRAGLGPAPTDIPERSRFFVGAAHRAARPNRLPFPDGPASIRPLRHTRNGFVFCRGGSQTRPPFLEIRRGDPCGRPKAFPLQGGRPIPPVRGKWPKAKRGREARPKVVTDEGALVARAPPLKPRTTSRRHAEAAHRAAPSPPQTKRGLTQPLAEVSPRYCIS